MNDEYESWLSLTREEPLNPDIAICDSHHHLWDRPGQFYSIDDMLADIRGGHNVIKTVFVDCRYHYKNYGPEELKPIGETKTVQKIAENTSTQKVQIGAGIVGFVNLALGAGAEPVIQAHIAASKDHFCGVRHSLAYDPSPDIPSRFKVKSQALEPKFRQGFAFLQKYGLTFDSWQFYPQLPEIIDLAKTFPDTTIIVDHYGGILGTGSYAGKRDEIYQTWKRYIFELAKCKNVLMKLGGLCMPRTGFGWETRAKPPSSMELAESMKPYYSVCMDRLGAKRCMFESNFPVDRKSCSYTVLWNAFKRLSNDCSKVEKSDLFYNTAMKAYRINLPRD